MKKLTIGEIEEMTVQGLEKRMTTEEAERMHKLGFAEYETFLGMMKDDATLSGLQENDLYVSIDEYLSHLEEKQKEYEQYEQTEEKQETSLATQNTTNNIMSFEDLRQNSQTQIKTYTNITDRKRLFNLDNAKPDVMLNDCENQVIKVKGVYVNIYEKTLKEPLVNEKTGEIIKEVGDIVKTISCILVDVNGKTYATGSKTFTYQLFNYIQKWGLVDFENGLDIKIVKKPLPNSSNRALGFELVLE
jgi:hypothetical protein